MFQSMATNVTSYEMDCLGEDIRALENDVLSAQEASAVGLKLVDLFTRVVNNAKTTLVRPFSSKPMLRSEFSAFEKGHKRQLKSLLKNVDISESETRVVVPENFVTTYPNAVSQIQKGLDILGFEDTLSRFASTIDDLEKDGVERYYLHIERLNKEKTKITKLSKTAAESITKEIFNPLKWDKKKEKQAKIVLISAKNMEETQDVIRNWEAYHKQAIDAHNHLENLNKRVEKIIDRIVKMETVQKKTISAIYNYLHAMGVQVDMYGAFIHHSQVVEHNYIVSAKILIKEHL